MDHQLFLNPLETDMKQRIALLLCAFLLLSANAFAQHHHGHRPGVHYGVPPTISFYGNGWAINLGGPPVATYQPNYTMPPTYYVPPYVAPAPIYFAPQRQLMEFCSFTQLGILPNGVPLQQKNCWLEWR